MVISFSDKPLRIALVIGLLISFASFCFGIFYLFESLTGRITQPGFASIIISIWLLGGTILFFIGILGLYIGRIFEKVKNRPNYIIEKEAIDASIIPGYTGRKCFRGSKHRY